MAADKEFNLTRAAHLGRQFIKYGLISVVVLIVGRFALTTGWAYWKATHPEPPPPPSVGFGILPPLNFPAQSADDKPLQYQIEIPNSRMPDFGDRAKVFLMQHSTFGLFTEQRAKEIAAEYGFVFAPTPLNEKLYRWSKSQPLQTTLEMNIENLTFELRTNYLSQPQLLGAGSLPDNRAATQLLKSYVSTAQELPKDIATASAKTTFLRSTGGELSEAISSADADFLQVDLHRVPVDGNKPFFTPDGTSGVIHAILSGAFSAKDSIVEMRSTYQAIDYAERHTYPLRSLDSAWLLVQGGEAYVANRGLQDTAVIRNITLGYYEDPEEEDYMQPIYVFEGDDGFLAFVPAIQSLYYQTSAVDDTQPAVAE